MTRRLASWFTPATRAKRPPSSQAYGRRFWWHDIPPRTAFRLLFTNTRTPEDVSRYFRGADSAGSFSETTTGRLDCADSGSRLTKLPGRKVQFRSVLPHYGNFQ